MDRRKWKEEEVEEEVLHGIAQKRVCPHNTVIENVKGKGLIHACFEPDAHILQSAQVCRHTVYARARVCVCVCLCVRERERVRVCVCVCVCRRRKNGLLPSMVQVSSSSYDTHVSSSS